MENESETSTSQIPLADLKENEGGIIVRLEGGQGFQRKLRTIGIREGKRIKILTRMFRGPVVVEVDGRSTTIGRGMAGKIVVDVHG